MVRDILSKRHDLKLILMSATLSAAKFAQYFARAGQPAVPTLAIPGFSYPVQVRGGDTTTAVSRLFQRLFHACFRTFVSQPQYLLVKIDACTDKTGSGQTQGRSIKHLRAVLFRTGLLSGRCDRGDELAASRRWWRRPSAGKKTALLFAMPFIYKNQHFTKTGSGQS
jgi:hypothetical protein